MSCTYCKNYSALQEPRTQKDKNGNDYTIHGYCFKKMYQADYHKGFAVFIPEGGCKQFISNGKKAENKEFEQLDLFHMPKEDE